MNNGFANKKDMVNLTLDLNNQGFFFFLQILVEHQGNG